MTTRSQLIRKAASLPVGHPERKRLLAVVRHEPVPEFPDFTWSILPGYPYQVRLSSRFNPGERAAVTRTAKRLLDRISKALPEIGLHENDRSVNYFRDDEVNAIMNVGVRTPDEKTLDDLIARIL